MNHGFVWLPRFKDSEEGLLLGTFPISEHTEY